MCLQVSLDTRCSADFCPSLTLTGGRGMGLGRTEATASCFCCFITHLLIVANGDFTAPPALIVSCGNALVEGKEGQPGKESLQGAYGPAQLVHWGPFKAGSGSHSHLVMRQGELFGPTDAKLNPTSSMS